MPESMYDKLGDLLSEALDSGITSFTAETPESAAHTNADDTEPARAQNDGEPAPRAQNVDFVGANGRNERAAADSTETAPGAGRNRAAENSVAATGHGSSHAPQDGDGAHDGNNGEQPRAQNGTRGGYSARAARCSTTHTAADSTEFTRVSDEDKEKAKHFTFAHFAGAFGDQQHGTGQPRPAYTIYKNLSVPEPVKAALAVLALTEGATAEQAKKAYREKLMYYHPDKWNSNAVLQKIAREKTQAVIESWNVLEQWFTEH